MDSVLYMEQIISRLRKENLFDMSLETYVDEDILRELLQVFVKRNLIYNGKQDLSHTQLELIIEEAKIGTIKKTIGFLSDRNILERTSFNERTGEMVYGLTDYGKNVYRKLLSTFS